MPKPTSSKQSFLQRRWFRWPWNFVRVLFTFVLLLISSLSLVLATIIGTEDGFQWTIRTGLEQYNQMIPGNIDIARIHGTLMDGFDLENIDIQDADGDPLVHLDAFRLRWDPIGMIDMRLSIALLSIEEGEIHLREKPRGSTFLDLAPPASEEPPPPEKPEEPDPRYLGISLPITLVLDHLNVDRLTVISYDENAHPSPLVENVSVQLSVQMQERQADVKIDELSAKVPVAELTVEKIALQAHWNDPAIHVKSLNVQTNLATLDLEDTVFDARQMQGNVALTVLAPSATLRKYSGLEIHDDAKLRLSSNGGLTGMELETSLVLGTSTVDIHGTVAAEPKPQADLDYRFSNLPPQKYGLPLKGKLGGKGRLKATGSELETLKADASFHCKDCTLEPFGAFSVDLDASLEDMKAHGKLKVDIADILVQAKAHSPQKDRIEADFSVNSDTLGTIASAFAVKGIDGRLDLQGQCKGELRNPSCTISALLEALKAAEQQIVVQKVTLDLDAKDVATKQAFDTRVSVENLSLPDLPLKRIDLNAKGTPKNLKATCSIEKDETNAGSFSIRLKPGPPLTVDLTEGTGKIADIALFVAQPGRVVVNGSAVQVKHLGLGIEEALLTVDGRFNPKRTSDLNVQLEAFELATLKKVVSEPELSGQTDVKIHLKGPGSAPIIHLATDIRQLTVKEHPYGDLQTTVDWKKRKIDVNLRLEKENQEKFVLAATVPATLNLTSGSFVWKEHSSHHAHWKLSDFSEAEITPFVKLPKGTKFTIENEGEFNGTIRQPDAKITVEGSISREDLEIPLQIQVHAQPEQQTVHAKFDESGPFALSLEAKAGAKVGGLMDGTVKAETIPIEANLSMNRFELETLNPLLPDALYDLRGQLNLALDVDGTVGEPSVNGTIGLESGEVTVVDLYQRYKNIDLSLKLTDTKQIDLQNLSLASGSGSMDMKGKLTLGEKFEPNGTWTLDFVSFPLEFPGVPPSRLDAKVDLGVSSNADDILLGVTLRETQVTVLSFTSDTPKDIPKNAHIVFVEEEKSKPKTETSATKGPNLGIHVDITDPIVILGNQVDMSWGGVLDVAQEEEGTAVTGGLENKRGWFEFLGNSFEVEQALLSFPDGTQNEPYINLTAGADTPEARVYLNVKGPASRPDLAFSSEPAMPQYQIFTLLVTGTTETNEDSDDQVQGKAANLGAGLIAFQYPELQRQMSDRLGIDRVSLTFGETTEEPILTVGKRLTRRIMVESSYHHNAPEDVNRAELKVDLMLTPQWDLETFYGDASVGGMDVFWHTSFGNEPPPQPSMKSRSNKVSESLPESSERSSANEASP